MLHKCKAGLQLGCMQEAPAPGNGFTPVPSGSSGVELKSKLLHSRSDLTQGSPSARQGTAQPARMERAAPLGAGMLPSSLLM